MSITNQREEDTDQPLICNECRSSTPNYSKSMVACSYTFPSTTLIHDLKFKQRRFLAPMMAEMICYKRRSYGKRMPDLICCIPTHKRSPEERGFNHAEDIARACARRLGIDLKADLLEKAKETANQRNLSRSQRLRNIQSSIRVADKALVSISDPKSTSIAIVDDVMTTGATFDAAAEALQKAGFVDIEVWAFARTPKHDE